MPYPTRLIGSEVIAERTMAFSFERPAGFAYEAGQNAKHAAHARLPHRLWLFYSNRRPEDAPFVAELQALEHAGASFRFVPTMTKLQNSRQPWAGETGPISKALLARHLPAGLAPIYYLAGPPGLVMCLRDLLGVLRVAEEDIRDEEFYGY